MIIRFPGTKEYLCLEISNNEAIVSLKHLCIYYSNVGGKCLLQTRYLLFKLLVLNNIDKGIFTSN